MIFRRRFHLLLALIACGLGGTEVMAQKLIPPPPPILLQEAPPPPNLYGTLPTTVPPESYAPQSYASPPPSATTFVSSAQTTSPAGPPSLQPFVCDQGGLGTASSQFVTAHHHLWLQLAISEKSDVQVGVNFNNVAGLQPGQIVIDYKGDVNSTFGPWVIASYQLPSGKVAGKVVSFAKGQAVSGASEGFNRVAFTGEGLGLPAGTRLRALEVIAIGENASGTITLGDVTVNGVTAGKLMNAQSTCDLVP